jgi:hypothetical protein
VNCNEKKKKKEKKYQIKVIFNCSEGVEKLIDTERWVNMSRSPIEYFISDKMDLGVVTTEFTKEQVEDFRNAYPEITNDDIEVIEV